MANFSGWRYERDLTATSVAIGAILALTTPSLAVDWTGTTSNNWFNGGNWAGGVPTNATDASIDTVTPNATVVGAAGAQAANLTVGVGITGALTIQSGGTLSNTTGIIGYNPGSTGTVIVDGAGSTWTNSNSLDIGSDGNGTLTIRNGAAVVAGAIGFIGNYPGGVGTVTIDGIGSTLTVPDIYIGWDGQATLNISNGARLITNTVGSSLAATGISTVTVDGAGSTWTSGGPLYIGDAGVGVLTIRNGATVSGPSLILAHYAGSTGTLNIGAAVGQAATAPGTFSAASVDLRSGTGQIVFNHTSANYTFAPVIIGSGAGTRTVRVEAGTTILTAASTYTGPTIINGGTLSVNGSIASSAVTVNAGGTLGGNGTVGSTTVNGGRLAPGNSIGLLTVQRQPVVHRGLVLHGRDLSNQCRPRQRHGHGDARRRDGQCELCAGKLCREAIHHPQRDRRPRRQHVRVDRQHQFAAGIQVEPELRRQQRLSESRAELHRAARQRPERQSAGRRQRAGQLLQPQWRHSAGLWRVDRAGADAGFRPDRHRGAADHRAGDDPIHDGITDVSAADRRLGDPGATDSPRRTTS